MADDIATPFSTKRPLGGVDVHVVSMVIAVDRKESLALFVLGRWKNGGAPELASKLDFLECFGEEGRTIYEQAGEFLVDFFGHADKFTGKERMYPITMALYREHREHFGGDVPDIRSTEQHDVIAVHVNIDGSAAQIEELFRLKRQGNDYDSVRIVTIDELRMLDDELCDPLSKHIAKNLYVAEDGNYCCPPFI